MKKSIKRQNSVIRPTDIVPASVMSASSATELQTLLNNETVKKRLSRQLTSLKEQNSRELHETAVKLKQVTKDIRLVKLKPSKSIDEWMSTSEKRLEMEKAEEKRKIGERIERLRRRSSVLGISSTNAKKIASIPPEYEVSFKIANPRRRFSIDSIGSTASSESSRGSNDKLPILLPHVGLVAKISKDTRNSNLNQDKRGRSNSFASQSFPPAYPCQEFSEERSKLEGKQTVKIYDDSLENSRNIGSDDDDDGNGIMRCNTWPARRNIVPPTDMSTVTRLPDISRCKINLTGKNEASSGRAQETGNPGLKTPNYYMCNYRNRKTEDIAHDATF